MTQDVRTIGDVIATYTLHDQMTIAMAFQEMEQMYKHHMTPAQRDAVGRTAGTRMVTVIRQLKADKKIG